MMNKRFYKTAIICAAACAAAFAPLSAAEPPRLIVNIVAGSMQAEALERYAAKFGDGGLRMLMDNGAVFTNAAYDCMQTSTPVSLATLSTGAMPPTHGVVAGSWFDYTTGERTELTADERERDFDNRNGKQGHSPRRLPTPTLAEMMVRADSSSRILSIALTPESSIVQTGRKGFCFWMDPQSCRWTTSSYYAPLLPSWVKSYNADDLHARFLTGEWTARFPRSDYRNGRSSRIFADTAPEADPRIAKNASAAEKDYAKVLRTPIGNTVLFDFAKYAVKCLNMGGDEHPDLLNICLDTSREVAETYGPESAEYEDMVYRLDNDLREFLAYLKVHMKGSDSIVVVFTAAHGSAPAFDNDAEERDRFNVPQFEVIMNAYLSARYGTGSWVLGCIDRSLYLNRSLIDEKRLRLDEVQSAAAAFALRFRGVSHAIPSTVLQSGSFADGYGRKMQNGFNPRYSGDIVIDLMPEWIEEREGVVSHSGSMYGYDTRVPLIFCGTGIAPQRRSEAVNPASAAPTLARLLGLGPMYTADAAPLDLDNDTTLNNDIR